MNRQELIEALEQENFNPKFYNIYGVGESKYGLQRALADYQFVLDREREKWAVYYYERGGKTEERLFNTEEEACRYFLNLMLRTSELYVLSNSLRGHGYSLKKISLSSTI